MTQAHQTQPNSLPQSIQQALSLDLEAAEQLLQLLEDEQAAMAARDRQALADIVNAKTDCLNQIEKQANNRYQILTSLERSIGEAEWKSLIEEQNDKNIQAVWEKLIDTLEQCRHANEVNGRLISRGQQTLHYMLSVLRGQLNPPSLYNQRGATETFQDGHSVTRA